MYTVYEWSKNVTSEITRTIKLYFLIHQIKKPSVLTLMINNSLTMTAWSYWLHINDESKNNAPIFNAWAYNFIYSMCTFVNKRPWATSLTWEPHLVRPQCWLNEKKDNYYLFFENWMVLIHLKLYPHHTRILCTKFRSWDDDF